MFSLHKIPVSFIFIFLFPAASGSDRYFLPAGAAETGMNYSCIMKQGFWSSFQNQALLPFFHETAFGINYTNRFGLSELGTVTAGIIHNVSGTGISAFYSHFGYKDYSRHSEGLGCGMKLSPNIAAGIQTDFFSEKLPGDFSEERFLTFETGLLINPSEKVVIGIHVFNPVPNSLRNKFFPLKVRAGAGIFLNPSLFTSAEAEMSTGGKLIVRTGLEYVTGKSFFIRGGFSSEYFSYSFGAGYEMKNLKIDFGFASNQSLGISSSFSVIFNIKPE